MLKVCESHVLSLIFFFKDCKITYFWHKIVIPGHRVSSHPLVIARLLPRRHLLDMWL